jgi:excisionase family DNA binding protein
MLMEQDTTPARRTYTVDETATILGLTREQTLRAIRRGEVLSVKIGNTVLVPMHVLDDLLAVTA